MVSHGCCVVVGGLCVFATYFDIVARLSFWCPEGVLCRLVGSQWFCRVLCFPQLVGRRGITATSYTVHFFCVCHCVTAQNTNNATGILMECTSNLQSEGFKLSIDQNPGWLGCIGDDIPPSYPGILS